MTKDQLIHFLATKKTDKLLKNADWSDLVTALGDLTQEDKDSLAKQIALGGGQVVISNIQRTMRQNASTAARTEAEAALSDDNLTLAELNSLL